MKTKIPKTLLILLILGTSLELSAQNPDALKLYQQGLYQESVKVCLAELQERPPNQTRGRMDSYSVLGWSYLRLGEFQKALNSAAKARAEMPYDVRIIEIEGEALYYLGQYTKALARFEEYVSLLRDRAASRIDLVYYFMGEIFLHLAEYQHADIAFTTALHHSPQIARWWARLGYTREQIPDKKAAQAAYTRAIELSPTLEEARAGLERVKS